MKNLRVLVLLLTSLALAAPASADPAEPFEGLGSERGTLSHEQIDERSDRLQASTTFSLLRFPAARVAPGRIFNREIWEIIERAARDHGLDPMLLAGMIFIESYGDPLAKSPTGPAGIAQLTKGSAKELGLATKKKIRVGSRAVTKTRTVGKGKNKRKVVETTLKPVYKTVDERYMPERAIPAMARRVASRRAWLGGKVDFAVAEYHMGAGRMAKLLSAYFGKKVKVSSVPAEMSATAVSYAELFWTNTPYHRPAVYKALEDLTDVDYSPTYYFRVKQAMRLLQMYRQSPDAYARLASAFQSRSGQPVLPNWESSFVSGTLASVEPVRSVREMHDEMGQRFVNLPEIALQFGVRAGGAPLMGSMMAAERSTIGSALFVAHQLRRLQGDRYTGFEINSMLAHETEENAPLRVHGLGWAFDIPTGRLSKAEKRDLKFVLTDLRQAGLLSFVDERRERTFHIVRHPDHAPRFEQFYWDAMAGVVPSAHAPTLVLRNPGRQH
jgi:soluble lytic murein transglycosylase-like protein